MCQCSDTLHFNGVHLLEWVIENTRGIHNLPAEILVVHVPDEERFSGECIRLNVYVCSCDLVDERRLSHVWVSADEQCSCGRVDGRETGDVLTHLFEVGERVFLAANDGCHSVQKEDGCNGSDNRTFIRTTPRMQTHLPMADLLSCLHLYRLSPNLMRRT